MRVARIVILALALVWACNPVSPPVHHVDGAMYTRPGGGGTDAGADASTDAGRDAGDARVDGSP